MATEARSEKQDFWAEYHNRHLIGWVGAYGVQPSVTQNALDQGQMPVLVRMFNKRLTEDEMKALGTNENESDTEQWSPGERAKKLGDQLTITDLTVLTGRRGHLPQGALSR